METDVTDFWKHWTLYKDDLYKVCLKVMKGKDEAHDALSAAMLTAHSKFSEYADALTNTKGWLVRLTMNICIDLLRKQKREKRVYLSNGFTKDSSFESELEKAANLYYESAEICLNRDELISDLIKIIKSLPSRLREPFLLRFFLKMPYREIALRFNLTEVNIRKRIQEARASLIKKLPANHDKSNQLKFSSFFEMNSRSAVMPSVLIEAIKEARSVVNRDCPEIDGSFTVSNPVRVRLPWGCEMGITIFLKNRLSRVHTRVKTLQRYIGNYPGGWKNRMKLAMLFYAIGEWDKAIPEFRMVLEKHPQSIEAALILGSILEIFEESERAEEVFKAALPYIRTEAGRHHIHGLMELGLGRLDRAQAEFFKATVIEKTNVAHFQRLAMTYLLSDRPVEASQVFEAVLRINQKDLYCLTYYYDCLILMGCLSMAEQDLARTLEFFPSDFDALRRKVAERCQQLLVNNAEGKKTREMTRKMEQIAPDAVEVEESRACYFFYRGEYQNCLKILRGFTEKRPDCLMGWYYYGLWLYRTGHYNRAAQAISMAFKLNKKNPQVNGVIVEMMFQSGWRSELREIIDEMLELFPGHWSVLSSASLVLAKGYGETELACELASRAVKFQPQLPEAYFRYGQALELAKQHEAAVKVSLKGWRLLPVNGNGSRVIATAWFLAQCFKFLGEGEATQTWIANTAERAAEFERYCPAESYYWKGKVRLEWGDSKGAAEEFHRAIASHLFYPFQQEIRDELKKIGANGFQQKKQENIENFTMSHSFRHINMEGVLEFKF
ncbi:MAG: sigma-70 family RNA polymerase sigma factor [Candidatus Omnitrophota bacterium]